MTDLAPESLGDGKVRFTWTAPGDDGVEGTAAWCQLKYSTARIVERVNGWPDLSEPLPITADGWHRRARGFNARQRAFRAAENLDGEPAPPAAGTRQSLVVTGLSPGVHYFALKTWDDGPNVSELSNVVRADVR